jgi:hypothetical protein
MLLDLLFFYQNRTINNKRNTYFQITKTMTNTTTVYSCMGNIKQFLQTSCKNLVLPPHQDTKYFKTEE